jgi:hypothetical protein
VENLIHGNFILEFLTIIGNTNEPLRLRREACWGLANMTSHRVATQIDVIALEGSTVRILIEFISTSEEHAHTNWKVVQSIVNILESADDPNSKYQFHGELNSNIYGISWS